jgi:hypothetical protein
METAEKSGSVEMRLAMVVVVLCGLVMAAPANAQVGGNAVWNSTPATVPSSAFIDATAFCHTPGSCSSSTDDFCTVTFKALSTLPTDGGVVDARGLNSTNTKSTSCSSPLSPFQTSTAAITVPSTLLLPAGTIPLGKTWVMPNGTKIIGQGAVAPFPFSTSATDAVTIIQASSSFSGTMIQMGPNSGDPLFVACNSATGCTEVGIENLELAGGTNGASVSGIINGQSQDMSYVNRVSMYQIGGIGLKVWNNAENSGPYTDISFNDGELGGTSTECAELDVTTLGIRGLNCQGSSSTAATTAVLVDAPNNTIKDAYSDILFNISGGTNLTNLVHIETGSPNPQNISIMGVHNNGGASVNTIQDSVTSTYLDDSYIAMYALGVSGVSGNGYSRFTTSTNTNTVTWGTGGTVPASCSKGSLFSCTGGSSCTSNSSCVSGSSGSGVYVCTASGVWCSLP